MLKDIFNLNFELYLELQSVHIEGFFIEVLI